MRLNIFHFNDATQLKHHESRRFCDGN